MKMVTNLDLSKLQLQNATLHPLASAPATPATGQMYYDTALGAPRWYDGAGWTNKATDSALLGGSSLATVLNRANHTGTQLAATISDFNTAVQANTLNSLAAPTADVAFNNHKATGLADPTNPGDAATMGWVQTQVSNAAAGIDAKPSVRLASTANLALSGLAAIDGVTPVAGDRILAKNQTTPAQNGVYVAAAGAWARAADADANNELTPGAFWYVEEGTANGKTQWRIENTGTIIVGTTAITINQFGGAGVTYTAGNGITLSGNAITAVAAPSGGLSVGASGIALDTSIAARKFSADIGDGATNPVTVTHNLGTQDVVVSVRDKVSNAIVIADCVANGNNTVQITFGVIPTAAQYRATVIG